MDAEGTIVAVAGPPGAAARGVVRLSGRGAFAAVAGALEPGCAARGELAARRRGVHLARLSDPPIPVLVLSMPGPASATGEDCAEVHAPGNPLLLERIVAALADRPGGEVRRAHPGEFSARAVLNGRTDLAGAERVAAAIAAETDAGLAAAEALRSGDAARAASRQADEVAAVLALVEAGIDFTDQEDVTAIARPELERRVRTALVAVRALAAAGGERPERTARVVLVGPPNAGKSSLFNALLGTERTVAGAERGTTRDAVEHPLALPAGGEAVLVDLPGIDRAVTELDALAQRRAADAIARADLVVECADDGAWGGTAAPGAARLLAWTKSDLRARGAPREGHLEVSARSGDGIDALRTAIEEALRHAVPVAAGAAALGAARRALLGEACSALDAALGETAPELVAANLRVALDRLGEVAGAIPPDDVLGRLFAGFCIGK
jgi:tRNA modification GTPase